MHHATNKEALGWNDLRLTNLKYHDIIWFDAIREHLKYQERKGTPESDPVLDQLICQGLINQDEKAVTPAYQQFLRYAAVMAGRTTD